MSYLENEAALTEFVNSFETGTFPGKQWKHAEHVALAACYLYAMPLSEATDRARSRIRAYNESQGGKNTEDSGYHETLTVFWLLIVEQAIDRKLPRVEATRAIAARFAAQRDLYREYYSFELLTSREARACWIPPDLKSLDRPSPDVLAASVSDLSQT